MANTYWNHNGKHQLLSDALQHLIPATGKSDVAHIELLRCLNNVYYDIYNNGGCNRRRKALEGITECFPLFKQYLANQANYARGIIKLEAFNQMEFYPGDCGCDSGQVIEFCMPCKGVGEIQVKDPAYPDEETEDCGDCDGTGETETWCDDCDGSGEEAPPEHLSGLYCEEDMKTLYSDLEETADAVIEYVASQCPIDVMAQATKET